MTKGITYQDIMNANKLFDTFGTTKEALENYLNSLPPSEQDKFLEKFPEFRK